MQIAPIQILEKNEPGGYYPEYSGAVFRLLEVPALRECAQKYLYLVPTMRSGFPSAVHSIIFPRSSVQYHSPLAPRRRFTHS